MRKLHSIRCGLLLLLVLRSGVVLSQAQLGMSPAYTITGTYTTPLFTVNYFTVLGINCYIKNKGNAVFTGTVNFNGDTLLHAGVPLFFSNPYNNVTIPPGDSMAVTGNIPVTPQYFKTNGGGLTVVVWPKASNALTLDSLFFKVFVNADPITSFEELYRKNTFFVFPNPCEDKLFVRFSQELDIEDIIIYDLFGKELKHTEKSMEVDVSFLPKGCYGIVLKTKENIHKTLFIKE